MTVQNGRISSEDPRGSASNLAQQFPCRPDHPWQLFGDRLRGFDSVRGQILPFSYLQALAVNTVLVLAYVACSLWSLLWFFFCFRCAMKASGLSPNAKAPEIFPAIMSQNVLFSVHELNCQYLWNRLPGNTCLWNALLCVEWDVKTHELWQCDIFRVTFCSLTFFQWHFVRDTLNQIITLSIPCRMDSYCIGTVSLSAISEMVEARHIAC